MTANLIWTPAASSSFHPPDDAAVETALLPPALQSPHVLGIERWNGKDERMLARPQLLTQHSAELGLLRQENVSLRAQLSHFIDISLRLSEIGRTIAELREENAKLKLRLDKMEEQQRRADEEQKRMKEQHKRTHEELRTTGEELKKVGHERDFERRLQRLEADHRQEAERRKRLYLTAKVVWRLEDACRRSSAQTTRWRLELTLLKFADKQAQRPQQQQAADQWRARWRSVFDDYGIETHFGSSYDFCTFLQEMKKGRNVTSGRACRLPLSIQQLTPHVLQHCRDNEEETLEDIEQTPMLTSREKEACKASAASEHQRLERRSEQMMLLLEQLVGRFPFSLPMSELNVR